MTLDPRYGLIIRVPALVGHVWHALRALPVLIVAWCLWTIVERLYA